MARLRYEVYATSEKGRDKGREAHEVENTLYFQHLPGCNYGNHMSCL